MKPKHLYLMLAVVMAIGATLSVFLLSRPFIPVVFFALWAIVTLYLALIEVQNELYILEEKVK